MVRVNNKLVKADWEQALSKTVDIILEQVKDNSHDLISLISPSSTVEEGYILQKIFRNLGSNNIDCRLRSLVDTNLGSNNIKVADVEKSDCIFLIGSSPRKEQPLLNHRIRKACLNKAKVNTLNPVSTDWNFDINLEYLVDPKEILINLAGILKHLYTLKSQELPKNLNSIIASEQAKQIAEDLNNSENPVLIFGDLAATHPDYHELLTVFNKINDILASGYIIWSNGGNTKGLVAAGAVPDKQAGGFHVSKPGDNITKAFDREDNVGTYVLFNIEPEYDCANGFKSLKKLHNAKKVICLTPYISEEILNYADVVLPIAPFTETSGTYVNLDNKWQSFTAAVSSPKDSEVRPGWKVLCAIARLLDLNETEFGFESSADIKQEVFGLAANIKSIEDNKLNHIEDIASFNSKVKSADSWNEAVIATMIAQPNCYKVDNIVRRADSLQKTTDAKNSEVLYISIVLAEKLDLNNADLVEVTNVDYLEDVVEIPVIINKYLSNDSVYLSSGAKKTLAISKPYAQVVLNKV